MHRIAFHSGMTAELSLEDDLKLAKQAGYDGVIATYKKMLAFLEENNQKDLKRLARESGIAIFGVANIPIDLTKPDEDVIIVVKRYARLVRAMKGNLVTVTPTKGTPKDMSEEEVMDIYAATLSAVADGAAEYGVNLAVEPEVADTFLSNPVQLTFIINRANKDNLGFVLDTFFFQKAGILLEELETMESHFFGVYLVDAPEKRRLAEADRMIMGEGIMDFERILKIIVDSTFRGVFTIKLNGEKRTKGRTKALLKKAREHLNSYLNIMAYL